MRLTRAGLEQMSELDTAFDAGSFGSSAIRAVRLIIGTSDASTVLRSAIAAVMRIAICEQESEVLCRDLTLFIWDCRDVK